MWIQNLWFPSESRRLDAWEPRAVAPPSHEVIRPSRVLSKATVAAYWFTAPSSSWARLSRTLRSSRNLPATGFLHPAAIPSWAWTPLQRESRKVAIAWYAVSFGLMRSSRSANAREPSRASPGRPWPIPVAGTALQHHRRRSGQAMPLSWDSVPYSAWRNRKSTIPGFASSGPFPFQGFPPS